MKQLQWLNNGLRKGLAKVTSMRGKNTASSVTPAQTTLQRGHCAETTAAEYLSGQGLKLIDRNVRAGRGEIDLIMQDGSTLVFVEVRARKAGAWVSAAESVSFAKRKKLIETAKRLLNENPAWRQHPCRFDVVAIGLLSEKSCAPGSKLDSRQAEINWIRDAFYAE